MKKFIIFGHAQHGKDAACKYLQDTFGLSYKSSSLFACEKFLFDEMKDTHHYKTIEECYNDRFLHRKYWYEAIVNYNTPIKTRLARELFSQYDIYCGIRDLEEFQAIRNEGLVDLAIFIDARYRMPVESYDSMKLNRGHADIIIDNNKSLEELHGRLYRLFTTLGYQPQK